MNRGTYTLRHMIYIVLFSVFLSLLVSSTIDILKIELLPKWQILSISAIGLAILLSIREKVFKK